jgi:REP element-mobilizing transposase RayT
MLKINGMAEHVHILIGLRPTQSIAELIKEVKEDSSGWINENRLVRHHFK